MTDGSFAMGLMFGQMQSNSREACPEAQALGFVIALIFIGYLWWRNP